jgi:hypothetical protein
MDIIQRKEAQKRLISTNVWPIWTQFKASLGELIVSYGDSVRPSGWAARIKPAHNRAIVVIQNRGIAPDGFQNQMLSITLSLRENNSPEISVLVEQYLERDGRHVTFGTQEYNYLIGADGETGEVYLTGRAGTRMKPAEVAEDLVEQTILK